MVSLLINIAVFIGIERAFFNFFAAILKFVVTINNLSYVLSIRCMSGDFILSMSFFGCLYD